MLVNQNVFSKKQSLTFLWQPFLLLTRHSSCSLSSNVNHGNPITQNQHSSVNETKKKKKGKVALAMSGGVDSCIAAHLLIQQGYQVTGIYMKNWDPLEETGHPCSTDQNWAKVQHICTHFQLPCIQFNFVKEYWNHVFTKALQAYETGETPNPDVFCNKHIKFGAFIEKTLGNNHFDYIATGHYAALDPISPTYHRLSQPKDKNKDQTYFLSAISGSILPKVLFPLSGLLKTEVKSMASKVGLPDIASQKESMGICFIGKRKHFGSFLKEYISQVPGPFVSLDEKTIIGKHEGLSLYTIGQCARVPGLKKKYFVAKKDPFKNIVYIVPGANHPMLFSDTLEVSDFQWMHPQEEQIALTSNHLTAKIRYLHPHVACRITKISEGQYRVHLAEKVRAVTPGQILVLYDGSYCLGYGIQR